MIPINIQAFPEYALPQRTRNAVMEVQQRTKAPIGLIASSALSAISLSCQNRINVSRLEGLESPCSLFFLSFAESGERKSTTDKLFVAPIREFEEFQAQSAKPELERYSANLAHWNKEYKSIIKKIQQRQTEDLNVDDLTIEREELLLRKPEHPRIAKLIFGDATPQAIAYKLHKFWPSAGLISDEAAAVFDSQTLHNLGLLNKFWDGDPFDVDRRHLESFTVRNARLTISLMTQQKTFAKFMEKQGRLAIENGFLARFLVCCPSSTQGSRFIGPAVQSTEFLPSFQTRLSEILKAGSPDAPRLTLRFSPEAQQAWVFFHNQVEAVLLPGRYLSDIRGNAAKIADNVARMAALFHYFEGNQGDISLETVQQAIQICSWYLEEYKRIFGAQPEVPRGVLDAIELEKWLQAFTQRFPGTLMIKKNDLSQRGPNQLREKGRLTDALNTLVFQQKVRPTNVGKTKYVELNPQFFARFY